MKPPHRMVILDAHAILHRAYHALPDFSSKTGEPTGALFGLVTMLLKILSELTPDYIVAAYDTPKPTFRKAAYADYKGQRVKTDDALIAQIVRSKDVFEAFSIPVYEKEGFEADDIIGSIITECANRNVEIIIASGDMDTLQLVEGSRVTVYTLRKGIKDTALYDEGAVRERFGFGPECLPDYKALRGDPSDNIPGVRGVGEKTATSLIVAYGTIENLYRALKKDRRAVMEKAGITERIANILLENEEEAEFSKVLALIRRDVGVGFCTPPFRWHEKLDAKKAEELFKNLDFRTLGERLKAVLKKASAGEKDQNTKEDDGEAAQNFLNGLYAGTPEHIDEHELKSTAVALWVLDSNLTNPSYGDILRYTQANNLSDARTIIFQKLKEENLEHVFTSIEKPLIPVIEKMQERGVKLDRVVLKDLSHDYHKKRAEIEADIFKTVGVEFNINSPKQLADVLFDSLHISQSGIAKTPTGSRSTRESELEKLRDKHPVVGKILEYRELQKLLSTYIDALPTLVDPHDRLHTTFLQHGTTTGRISSQNPNLQNIPIKTEQGRHIRRAFVAEEGYKLLSCDYSQIELRVAALLSHDEKLIEIFTSDGDVHTSVAAHVFGVPEEAVDKEMRRRAKIINFGILYGMGVNALRSNLGTTRAEAQEFLNEFFRVFRGLHDYLELSKLSARQKGYSETFFGRKRRFGDIRSNIPHIRAAAERMALNAPIQGTQADIIKKAMVRIDAHISRAENAHECFLVLQIHDELLFEVKSEKAHTYAREIRLIMESVMTPEETRGVPLKVDVSLGDNWMELERVL